MIGIGFAISPNSELLTSMFCFYILFLTHKGVEFEVAYIFG
jgi:hypothetical protein